MSDPPPTRLTIPEDEHALTSDPAPMRPGGSDMTLISLGKKYGTFEALKNEMLYLGSEGQDDDGRSDGSQDGSASERSRWDDLDVHVVWGERSVWEVPKAAWEMQKEVEAGRLAGRRMRKVQFTQVKGGNHFVSE